MGRDATLGRLPGEAGRKAAGQRQTAERHQSPVAGLRTGGPDPLVPDLAGALIGRLRLRGSSVSLDSAFEDHRLIPFLDVGGGGGTAAITDRKSTRLNSSH